VAWIFGHWPEKQKRFSASIVAGGTGCQAPGLQTANQPDRSFQQELFSYGFETILFGPGDGQSGASGNHRL
jgi:hypothetical protein